MERIELTRQWALSHLPKRPQVSNKGTFGRLFAYVGSRKYMGAMHLAIESMLRGGVGYVELCASRELWESVLPKFPELLYCEAKPTEELGAENIYSIIESQRQKNATLIGCGSGIHENLRNLTVDLIRESGNPLIIDADAINSLSCGGIDISSLIKSSKRRIIFTPHPLEFSRLCGMPVDYISENREEAAEDFARKTSSVILLKGHRTVITDGNKTYINTTGSSALAKAGSGDCLAGLLSALVATELAAPLESAALAAYIHGLAADNLADEYSEYGVTPSDLPKEMARVIRGLCLN